MSNHPVPIKLSQTPTQEFQKNLAPMEFVVIGDMPMSEGVPGPQGLRGPEGPRGMTGETGARGLTGEKGDKGDRGDKGDTGLTGPEGDPGQSIRVEGYVNTQAELDNLRDTLQPADAGNLYIATFDSHLYFWNGTAFVDGGPVGGPRGADGAAGPRGDKGDIGPAGRVGDTGPQGDKGDKGDVGDTGPQGEAGPQGLRGLTGAQGLPGVRGLSGDKGDTGATGGVGPKGDTGLKGDTGAKGDTGPKGDAGPGVASGGTTGQILEKSSNANHATRWVNRNPTQSEVGGRRVISGAAPNNTNNDLTDIGNLRIRTRNTAGVPFLEIIALIDAGVLVDFGSMGQRGAPTVGVGGRSVNYEKLVNTAWTLLSGAADYCTFMIRDRSTSHVWEGSFLSTYGGANTSYAYTFTLTRVA